MIAMGNNPILACFPLHNYYSMTEFRRRNTCCREFPLDKVRNYFGEEVALYFGFVSFYIKHLVFPSILGVAVFLAQHLSGKFGHWSTPIFFFVMAIWSAVFLEFWRREESRYSIRWGQTFFKDKEPLRPDFKGHWTNNPVDGKPIEVYPWYLKLFRMMFAQSVITTLVVLVISSVFSLFYVRSLITAWDQTFGSYIASFAFAININIWNFVYGKLSQQLTKFENHRTDSSFMSSLISKSFAFKFINSYNSLFYLAFFRRYDPWNDKACKSQNCVEELQQQLFILLASFFFTNNIFELLLPKLSRCWKSCRNKVKGFAKTLPEQEFELSNYGSTYHDYDEIVVLFGYVSLFVTVLPIAPAVAALAVYVENKLDLYNLCKQQRRPEPRGAQSIGTWFPIMNLLSAISIITNSIIIVYFYGDDLSEVEWVKPLFFTMESNTNYGRFVLFVILEHSLLLFKFLVSYFFSNEAPGVHQHKLYQDNLQNSLLEHLSESHSKWITVTTRAGATSWINKETKETVYEKPAELVQGEVVAIQPNTVRGRDVLAADALEPEQAKALAASMVKDMTYFDLTGFELEQPDDKFLRAVGRIPPADDVEELKNKRKQRASQVNAL
mmetsp:Transcript_14000/g.27157  ORF Transcript_14000/g.27157 Transcript_14000/m.27157 type:complete len:611 (+) Transcript_14000:852-2684(+)